MINPALIDCLTMADIEANFNRVMALLNAIPDCPTDTDGTYTLSATVEDGEVEYEWTAAEEEPAET